MKKTLIIGGLIILFVGLRFATHMRAQTNALSKVSEEKNMINELIKNHSTFMISLSHSLLPGKVRQWQQKGIIAFPAAQFQWNNFRQDMSELGSYLHRFQQKEIADAARDDERIQAVLRLLAKVLKEHLKKVKLDSPFGIEKESLLAVQQLINTYATQLYQRNILNTMRTLFIKVDDAMKAKSEQEAAQRPVEESSYQATTEYESESEASYNTESSLYESSTVSSEEPVYSPAVEDDSDDMGFDVSSYLK